MEDTMNRLWRGFSGDDRDGMESWAVPLDVVQEGDQIVVHASLPGVNPNDINVSLEDGVLSIRGQTQAEREDHQPNYLLHERRTGSFYRAIRLPDTVDPDKAESHYEHGVLSISFPKLEAKKAKQLTINVGSGAQAISGQSTRTS
jgi:HSP20 family protein